MKNFSLRFLAFCVVPSFILVGCAPPEIDYSLKRQSDHPGANPSAVSSPETLELPTNITAELPTSNKTRTENPSAPTKVTTSRPPSVVPFNATSQPTSTGLPKNEMNTVKNESATAAPPHHRKPHPTAPQVTHSPITVPVNRIPDSENVLEDVARPSHSRPLRAHEKFNPTFGAIVAAICFSTAVGGYIILMVWRKRQIDRYGARQMLINEDDFGDIQDEDMRHFEASCIQIDA